MNFTSVRKLDGTQLIASASIMDADGDLHTADDDVLEADGTPHTIFTPAVEVSQVHVVTFRLSDANNRVFKL